MKNIKLILLCVSLFGFTTSQSEDIKYIIFDPCLLFPVSDSKAAKFVSKWPAAKYTLYFGETPKKAHFFKALEFIPAKSKVRTFTDNLKMPAIFTDWLAGIKSNTAIKNTIISAMNSNNKMVDCEIQVFTDVLNLMFTPSIFLQTIDYHPDFAKIIQELKQHGYTIIFAANWDVENYKALKRQYSTIFNVADHTFISSEIGYIKPEEAFYKHIITTCNIDPKNCISCELEQQFLHTPQKLGMKTIHWGAKESAASVRTKLKNAGIRI